jgi:hypothetical protein
MFFIIMTILILSIIQIFLIEYSLFKDLHIAFAQSTNSTSIFVPSNMNKMEITLKNDQSANPSSIIENPLLIALISGLTAILGGIMGSHMTNRSNRQMEEKKYERERKREKELQQHQEDKNEEYKKTLTASTYAELLEFSFWLAALEDKERWEGDNKRYTVQAFKSVFETISMEFLKIPYDTRLTLFSPEIQYSLQTVYYKFRAFTQALIPFIEEYEKTQNFTRLTEAIKNLHPRDLNDIIDGTATELRKILPESIAKKLEKI